MKTAKNTNAALCSDAVCADEPPPRFPHWMHNQSKTSGMSDRKPAKKRGRTPLGSSFDNPVRLIVLSNGCDGKSALITKLLDNRFTDEYDPSVEDSFEWKSQDGVCVTILDTAGAQEYSALTSHYVRDSHFAMVLFDVTSRVPFDGLEEYIDQFLKVPRGGGLLPFMLVATKKDLESERKVTTQEAQEFAAAHNVPYIETSAKTGENVHEAFEQAVKLALETQNDNCGEDEDGKEHKRCTVQ